MLKNTDITRVMSGLLPLTAKNLELADRALDLLWVERLRERGYAPESGRSNSCKFAALLARSLFGGRLDGNDDHVFVMREGALLDLNADQADVKAMGEMAHQSFPWMLGHRDYRAALGSCVPRVEKWANWVLEHPEVQKTRSNILMTEECQPRC